MIRRRISSRHHIRRSVDLRPAFTASLRPASAVAAIGVCWLLLLSNTTDAQEPNPKPVELPPIVITSPAAKPATKKTGNKSAQPKSAPQTEGPPAQVEAAEPADPTTALGYYNPSLDLGALKLPAGTTLTTAGPVDGYRALSAVSATRTATPIERIPQSIQVVPKSLIRDQSSVSVDDALQNVSGVEGTLRLQTPAYESTRIRGFFGEQWLDGMQVYFNTGHRDAIANIERIEVLKGPNAILYGGGTGAPVGGAVNVVSKMPTNISSGEVGLTFGSDAYLRPIFDLNQPLSADGTVLFRMTGEYVSAGSFVDVLETDAYSINPTLTFTNKTDTTLTIQGRSTRWSQQDYQGLPAFGTVAGNLRLDHNLFIGPSDLPDSTTESHSLTATLHHKFSPGISGTVNARWSGAEIAQRLQLIVGSDGVSGNTPLIPPSNWLLSNVFVSQSHEEFTINQSLEAKFSTPSTEHTLLVGADYTWLSDSGFISTDLFLGGLGLVDLSNPVFPFPYAEPPLNPFTSFADAEKVYVTRGLYLQVQSTVLNRLHLLGGLRLANVDIDSLERKEGTREQAAETKLLPRIGALLDVWGGLSVYANYSEGLRGHPIFTHKGAPDPEESLQREAGIKLNLGNGLSGTAALFEIERTNVPLTTNIVTVGVSDERSRGIEADLLWQPDRNWQVLGSFAYIDALHVTPSVGAPAGSKLIGVPEYSGRVWINYRFDPDILEGWSVGGGIYAASEAPVDLANLYYTDSYFTIDAKLGYDSGAFSAVLAFKNLTGEEYFVPHFYAGGRVAAGDARAVYGTIAWKY